MNEAFDSRKDYKYRNIQAEQKQKEWKKPKTEEIEVTRIGAYPKKEKEKEGSEKKQPGCGCAPIRKS